MHKGSQIVRQPPPTNSTQNKCARNRVITWCICIKLLTKEAKELNLPKIKFGRSTVANFDPLLNDQSVMLVPKN